MKKFFLFIVCSTLLVFFAPFWLGLIFRDIQPVDTSDLQIEIETPTVNAYYALAQLDSEANVFDILDKAAKADGFLEPALISGLRFENAVPTISGLGDAVQSSINRAQEFIDNDDAQSAANELYRTLLVIQMIQDAPGMLIQNLVAMNAKSDLLNAVLDMDLEMDLDDFSDNEAGLIKAIKLEFMLSEAFVQDGVFENEMLFNAPYYFHPNETIAVFADRARYAIASSQAECDETVEDLPAPSTPNFLFFTENAIGRLMIETLSVQTSGQAIQEKKCTLRDIIN